MRKASFNIHPLWGGPREPEYRNGSIVRLFRYEDGDVVLNFSVLPLQPDNNACAVLEVPATIRMVMGNDWAKCEVAIQRLVEFLKTPDASNARPHYADIVVDKSMVPKWLPTQMALLEARRPFLADSLPTASTLALMALGLVLVLQRRYHLFGDHGATVVAGALLGLGLLILGMLMVGEGWL